MQHSTPRASPLHDRVRELLATAIDFPLGAGDRAQVARHVAECASCRAYATAVATDARAIGDLASVAPPKSVEAGLLDAVEQPLIGRARFGAVRTRLVVAGILAVALAGLLVQVLERLLR